MRKGRKDGGKWKMRRGNDSDKGVIVGGRECNKGGKCEGNKDYSIKRERERVFLVVFLPVFVCMS